MILTENILVIVAALLCLALFITFFIALITKESLMKSIDSALDELAPYLDGTKNQKHSSKDDEH